MAILETQISKLNDHIQAVSATSTDMEMWQQEQQQLRGLVDAELWMLYTTLTRRMLPRLTLSKRRQIDFFTSYIIFC